MDRDVTEGHTPLDHPSMHRLMAIAALKELAAALHGGGSGGGGAVAAGEGGVALVEAHCLPPLLALTRDPVPNVRCNAAKALAALSPLVGAAAARGEVQPALKALFGDDDRDVQYFARRAWAELGA